MIRNAGFALIEVLIALLIIALALGSLIETNATTIRHMDYLDEKTAAIWIAENVATELQLGMIALPSPLDNINGEVHMLNHEYFWSATFEATADHAALKTFITVKQNENAKPLLQYVTFLTPAVNNNA
jgi:general secretion pathway protein I